MVAAVALVSVTIIFTSFLRGRAPSTPSSRELHHLLVLPCEDSCCLPCFVLPILAAASVDFISAAIALVSVTIIFTSFLRGRAPSTPSSRELHHLPVLSCEDSCCLPCSVLPFLAADATFAAASVDLFPPLLLLQSCLAAAALMDFR